MQPPALWKWEIEVQMIKINPLLLSLYSEMLGVTVGFEVLGAVVMKSGLLGCSVT
jgi:hypothetical protein